MQERLAGQLATDRHRETLERLSNLEDLGLEELPDQMELAATTMVMILGHLGPLEPGQLQADGTGEAKNGNRQF